MGTGIMQHPLGAVESLLIPTTLDQALEPMLTIINLLLQLRVLQQEAAPQAANRWATLLEWEVYSPTSVNLTIYKQGSCDRLKYQNRVSTELEADWQTWQSYKQLHCL